MEDDKSPALAFPLYIKRKISHLEPTSGNMMNVAFIVGFFPSLSETFILNQITGLLESGIEVEIFAQHNPHESKIHPDVFKFNLIRKVSYFPDIPRNRALRVLKGFFLFIKYFLHNPRRITSSLNFFKFGKDALSLKILYYNIPFLKKKFDILLCHFGQNGIIGTFLKKTGAGEKLVTAFHGYDLSEFVKLYGKEVYADLFECGDQCLPISHFWKKKLIEMGCKSEKIKVHRMGINLEQFPFPDRGAVEDEKIFILTVGRLVEKKGHEFAIRSVAQVVEKFPRVQYAIIGSGSRMGDLKDLVYNLGLEDRVYFFGDCDRNQVLDLYKKAHIFLLPSITSSQGDMEGIPVVLLEAQAMGLPVISTFHSGIPEGVVDGKSGFLVAERDVESLTEKILYLAEHAGERENMGRNGRQWIETEFDQKKLDIQLLKIFEDLRESKIQDRCKGEK